MRPPFNDLSRKTHKDEMPTFEVTSGTVNVCLFTQCPEVPAHIRQHHMDVHVQTPSLPCWSHCLRAPGLLMPAWTSHRHVCGVTMLLVIGREREIEIERERERPFMFFWCQHTFYTISLLLLVLVSIHPWTFCYFFYICWLKNPPLMAVRWLMVPTGDHWQKKSSYKIWRCSSRCVQE